MPPEKYDSEGNPFVVGWVYEYYNHKLELTKIDRDGRAGDFLLKEDYAFLSEGWTGHLHFDNMFHPLYPADILKNNKAASKLLSKEW